MHHLSKSGNQVDNYDNLLSQPSQTENGVKHKFSATVNPLLPLICNIVYVTLLTTASL